MPSSPPAPPPRTCIACGRSFEWRRKWARDWERVRYCSKACRRHGPPDASDRDLERAILDLLAGRAATASACPSEVAKRRSPDDWRSWMEPVKRAARRLCAEGRLVVLQGGRPVDPDTARGPIRLRRIR